MALRLLWALCAFLLAPALALAQGSLLQAGPPVGGHSPMYSPGGGFQAVLQDSGPASGGMAGLGVSEHLQVNPSSMASSGTGPLGTHDCRYSAAVNSGAYYYLCLDANAQGGGLLAYGNAGTAPPLPFSIGVNGTLYQLPFSVGGVTGPNTSTVNDFACWNNTTGTLLKDCTGVSSVGFSGGTTGFTVTGSPITGAGTITLVATNPIKAPGFVATGTTFTVSGCSATSPVGGPVAGVFTAGVNGTCTATITMAGATGFTAPNGWACAGNVLATANLLTETSYTATTAVMQGTTLSGQTVIFQCQAF